MDECLRLPHCDKYIFLAEGSHNCKLLNTRDQINIGQNLAQYNSCAPENITVSFTRHVFTSIPLYLLSFVISLSVYMCFY